MRGKDIKNIILFTTLFIPYLHQHLCFINLKFIFLVDSLWDDFILSEEKISKTCMIFFSVKCSKEHCKVIKLVMEEMEDGVIKKKQETYFVNMFAFKPSNSTLYLLLFYTFSFIIHTFLYFFLNFWKFLSLNVFRNEEKVWIM